MKTARHGVDYEIYKDPHSNYRSLSFTFKAIAELSMDERRRIENAFFAGMLRDNFTFPDIPEDTEIKDEDTDDDEETEIMGEGEEYRLAAKLRDEGKDGKFDTRYPFVWNG